MAEGKPGLALHVDQLAFVSGLHFYTHGRLAVIPSEGKAMALGFVTASIATPPFVSGAALRSIRITVGTHGLLTFLPTEIKLWPCVPRPMVIMASTMGSSTCSGDDQSTMKFGLGPSRTSSFGITISIAA